MASPCPCGCGRKIGFPRQDAAGGLAEMDEALPVLREAVDALLRESDARGHARDLHHQSERFLQFGEDLRRNFLAHAHGSVSPSITPDLDVLRARMNVWVGTATLLLESASELRTSH